MPSKMKGGMRDWIEAERQGSFRFSEWLDFDDGEGRRELESWE